jgi:two-component system, OmpR family, sensor kinase
VLGWFTVHRIRSDFNRQVLDTTNEIAYNQLKVTAHPLQSTSLTIEPPLGDLAPGAEHSAITIYSVGFALLDKYPKSAPSLGAPLPWLPERTVNGYRVLSRYAIVRLSNGEPWGHVIVQYGRRVSDTEATVKRVELLLILGAFAGTALALLAGMAIARRAMSPIAQLTSAAAEIKRTRDPSRTVPQPKADDEVAELARMLEGMLRELGAARDETEAALARQRQFVADASHELRTPLTSVLANLELLAESLHGDEAEAARSALRSSQRMRRLVADLLLLARGDVGRAPAHEPCDLAHIAVEAAAELGPLGARHEITLDVHPAPVHAARDEIYRAALNLIENALRHTPPGTEVKVHTGTAANGQAELVVEDNGPGVPEELRSSLFERFVRGAGDRGGSFGLGLAIVRAVAVSHGGSVRLTAREAGSGARFILRLPAASHLDDDGQHHRATLEPVVDQLR